MAISNESYGRGQPVYANGSHAPTSGTVDPSGYIDRSLNNQSQSRSGLAQAALSRLDNKPQTSPGVLPLGDIKALQITPTGQLIPVDEQSQLGSMSPAPNGAGVDKSTMTPNTTPGLSPLAQAALSRIMAGGNGA